MTETLEVIESDLAIPGVRALTTTRRGGVSEAPFDALNLGDHVGDDKLAVERNRVLIREHLGIPEPHWLRQVHGTRAVEAGRQALPEADAQWTDTPDIPIAILSADCLPVVLAAQDGSCIGVAHAGWRGLAAGVIEALIAAMPLSGSALSAWLGPAISADWYQVGAEVREQFLAHQGESAAAGFGPASDAPGFWMANLSQLAHAILEREGVQSVSGGTFCTAADPGRFYSHRRDGAQSGRMATLAWLTDTPHTPT